ncbi:ABC transporter ATP-binding protein [Mycolicibacterium tokaiense]|uniref:ABC transporter ATP-binding protein n=1 Tax=Mycolicibacterium tokaiense TaxID=39695 RepID=A0A378TRD6_9MYCO|nr:ABC transporter ATP-binding protein [Mycolicibacterium tokaiense]BBY89409.1 ABC transporter ATP-binding protein [Mycolicibacterium tokaiense]STZ62206.1 ABC transporter ATP-binding protein [Mycolicibacterium tokaiense]
MATVDSGPLLSVRDLAISYTTSEGTFTAVEGVEFDVHPGEVVAIVGESGSGKSTSAQAVIGMLARNGTVTGGSIVFDGTDLTALSERQWQEVRGAQIGLVPQDPIVSLNPVKKIGDQVGEVLRIHGLARRRDAAARAVELLEQAGLTDPEARARQYPHQLSGGMRQRVLIAAAMAAKPKLIIADEPTSALDVTVQRQILDHIEQLTRDTGTAMLLITHDLGVAADRADTIVVMSRGRVVESGATARVLQSPQHNYTRTLLSNAPSMSSARLGRSRTTATAPDPVADRTVPTPALLAVNELSKEFALPRTATGPRTLRAVDGVSFELRRGQTLSLVGESGSGKSTTARMVLRLETPTSGQVDFDGIDVTGLPAKEMRQMRRRMQLVYQNPYASLDPRFTVEQIITEPLTAFGIGDKHERASRAAELVEQVALPSAMLRRLPAELSGGQRQRVAIARALALDPEFIVCDEAVSALDVTVQAQILELLVQLQEERALAYLFISHDLAVVRQVSDHVAVMRHGKLVETGSVDAIFGDPQQSYTRELLRAIPGRRWVDMPA